MLVQRENPLSGVVAIILVVGIAGVVVGLALTNADIVNPWTRSVEAEAARLDADIRRQQMQIDLDLERQQAAIVLEQQRTREEAQTQAELARIERAHAHAQRLQEQELLLQRLTRYVLLAVGGLSILIVSAGLAGWLSGARRLSPSPSPASSSEALWRDPEWRTEQIRLARQREQEKHQVKQDMTSQANGNGRS